MGGNPCFAGTPFGSGANGTGVPGGNCGIYRAYAPSHLLFLLLLPAGLRAQQYGERILSFHSDISVYGDSSMVVRETIAVNATGSHIRHGIYRDFPTNYRDRWGNRVVVDFDVLAVERDGQPERWRVEPHSNGVRLYFGDKNSLIIGRHDARSPTRPDGSSGSFPIMTNSIGT